MFLQSFILFDKHHCSHAVKLNGFCFFKQHKKSYIIKTLDTE